MASASNSSSSSKVRLSLSPPISPSQDLPQLVRESSAARSHLSLFCFLQLLKISMILGSSSPARREILTDMGYEFAVMSADIDEKAIRREKPEELVKALAEAKAEAIKLKIDGDCARGRDDPTLLITSDQVMVSKGVIRERPRSMEEAREFIKGYSGDRAFAVNFVLVTNLSTGDRKGGWDIPEICFHHIPDNFIERVVKEGDMTCVAGGLKLTHPSALPFIKELVGTADSVRGLPRELTERLIQESLEGLKGM